MCRAGSSLGFTLECLHELFGKRFKKLLWDGELALSEPDRALLDATRLQRTNLGDRLITLAEEDGLSFPDHGEVTGQMGLSLMNVKSNHGTSINQVVN
jgi:hypothetical protein